MTTMTLLNRDDSWMPMTSRIVISPTMTMAGMFSTASGLRLHPSAKIRQTLSPASGTAVCVYGADV